MSPETPPTGTRLHNADWGFDSNCFVCEPTNEGGLHIPFYADAEADRVTARFTLDSTYSGAPTFVHGGVTAALLDEAQAWATIALAGRFAVTVETTISYARPVMVGETYDVEARLTDVGEKKILTEAEILDASGEVCASTASVFVVISEAVARAAVGGDLGEETRGFVR